MSQTGRESKARDGRRFAHALGAKALAKSQDRPAPAKRRRRFDELIGKARIDEIIPAIGWTRFGGEVTCDNEALSRARHGDIEQAPIFARLSRARLGPRRGDRIGVFG